MLQPPLVMYGRSTLDNKPIVIWRCLVARTSTQNKVVCRLVLKVHIAVEAVIGQLQMDARHVQTIIHRNLLTLIPIITTWILTAYSLSTVSDIINNNIYLDLVYKCYGINPSCRVFDAVAKVTSLWYQSYLHCSWLSAGRRYLTQTFQSKLLKWFLSIELSIFIDKILTLNCIEELIKLTVTWYQLLVYGQYGMRV